ncbi:MAG TPA: Fe-S cluster assembly protein SufD [Actinobacteria bacterium]|nr:feS cluster assembly protein SufD [bacterium BMS3Bbin01]HDK45528.1 Fe-S cluster assembly protein SufD [Actinomycetota bacterium]
MQPLDQDTLDRLNATALDWVRESRSRGFEQFEKLTMPAPEEEAWRYVNLDFALSDFGLADQGTPMSEPDEVAAALGELAGHATILDGYATVGRCDDAIFTSVAAKLGDGTNELRDVFGTGIDAGADIFSAAHHAFVHDGVFLHVPAGRTVERPFYVDVQATRGGAISFPHITIVVECDAEASIVIGFRSPDGEHIVVNPQIEAFVRDAGRLKLSTYQRFGNETRSIIHDRVVIGRDATAKLGEVGFGGSLGRLDLDLELTGKGAHTDLVGAFYGEHHQVLDYRLLMHHVGVSTSSDVFLKGAVQDTAESVFTGLVRIERDAAKTSAFETNRNLVLSEGARANSVPNLEILCDDVICGHGSTVGPLDEEPLYYLMSRGLSRERASRLLIRGFFEEALDRLPQPELAVPARVAVNRRFVTAQQEGRV